MRNSHQALRRLLYGSARVHPYMLLNYQKTTHDVFTIAHEMGHSMHTYYSEKAQPVAKADYKIFVAEVASTCNEVLLLKYLLSTVTDDNVKKYLLQYYLDMLRTTMYRQAMFAEFEQITHAHGGKGTAPNCPKACAKSTSSSTRCTTARRCATTRR